MIIGAMKYAPTVHTTMKITLLIISFLSFHTERQACPAARSDVRTTPLCAPIMGAL
jgi:hypothetical protein